MRNCYKASFAKSILLVMFVAAMSLGNLNAQYCIPTTTNGCASGDHVTNVTVAGINNTTGPCLVASYSDYTTTVSPGSMIPGQSYPVTVNVANGGTEYAGMWIDFNQNGTFEASEFTALTVGALATTWPFTGTVNVPIGALAGPTRLRVRSSYNAVVDPTTACGTYSWGETEDYTINMASLVPCTGTPVAGTATSTAPANNCTINPFTLALTGSSLASGITYQWQTASSCAGPWTNLPSGASASVTITQTAPSVFYRCVVTCNNGGGSSNSSCIQVTTTVCPPVYCASGATSAIDTEILGFSINGVSNTSNCTTAAPGTGSILGRYSNYYPLGALTTVIPGSTIPITINIDDCTPSTFYFGGCAVWIDFNGNGVFDAAEQVYIESVTTQAPRTVTAMITIPASAVPGLTGLRVTVAETFVGATLTPCLSYSFGETEDYYINIASLSPCVGAPVAGTTVASTTNITCPGSTLNLSLNGHTYAANLNYQWQTSPTGLAGSWTNVGTPGPYASNYSTVQSVATLYYQCLITCTNGGATSSSTPVMVTAIPQPYTTIPYVESFENGWVNGCGTNDIPKPFWKNTPATGNSSWRREDDITSASWTNNTLGGYTPAGSDAIHSARFHSYSGTGTGSLDLFVNCNTADITKRLDFDYINTNGNDSLTILISTDGGSTFFRVDSVQSGSTGWRTKTAYFNSTSSTTVIRFMAYGLNTAGTDMGIDNLKLNNFPSCTGTPVAGTTQSTSTNITCPGNPFTLSLNGSTIAGALSYQWQSSPNNTTWTPITGANSATYTTVQSVASLYYRCVVTCGNGGAFSNSNGILVTAVPQPYATLPYTQGFENNWISSCATNDVPDLFWKNTPHPTDPDASFRREDDLISAGWTNAAFGIYTPPASVGLHSARFHSYDVNSGSRNSGFFDVFLNCNTADPVKRLSFDVINTSGTDSVTILLSTNGGATFTRLDSTFLATSWRTKTIYFNSLSATTVIRFSALGDFGTTDIGIDNVQIINYPNCATPVSGTASASQNLILCPGATFTLSLSGTTQAAGITYQWQSSTSATGPWTNLPTASTNATYTGTQTAATLFYRCVVGCSFTSATSNSNAVQIDYNITQLYAALPYAESFENTWINGCGTQDLPTRFWKNTPVTGNNSWRREDDITSAAWTNPTLGIYTPAASDGIHSARFHTYGSSTGLFGTLDLYVNCFTPASVKRLVFDYINLSQTSATNYDHDSIFVSTDGGVNFTFIDTAGLATVWTTKALYFTSFSATTVIRFKARSDFGVTDMGLDNIKINNWPNCSGKPSAGIATANPNSNACASLPLKLNVPNASVGSGLIYTWQQTTNGGVSWTNVASSINATDQSQSLTITQFATTTYRCIVKCVLSGQSDTSAQVAITSPALPGGNYTINADIPTNWTGGPTGNFNSFNDAYNAVKCGITAPTTFSVVNATSNGGVYTEQLIISGVVPNSSAVNTITFKGNGNTLKFASGNTNERATLKLRNTKYFVFDSLTIQANTGTYGFGVHIISDADSNVIKKCTILSNTTAGSTNYAGIVISGSDASATGTGTTTAICDFNKIDSNTVIGGYYGITQAATFVGGAHNNNIITNNKVQDFYLYGIYINSTFNTIIEKNTISRPNIPSANLTTCYGIYFTGQSNNALVSKNIITNPFAQNLASTSTFGGIYFTSCTAVGVPNTVRNNLIYGINGNGLIYGIYNFSSGNIGYFHNTISLDSINSTSASTVYGYYQTGTSNTVSFTNNLISIKRGGTGTKYCAYVTTPFSSADNNNLYKTTAATNNIGYYNAANRLNLIDWKTATLPFSSNQNDISEDPAFLNSNYVGANYRPTNAAMDNRGAPGTGAIDDIAGLVRSTSTPDIGAYEFIPTGCTTPLPAATSVVPTTITCQTQSLPLTVTMGVFGSGQTFQWQSSTSSTGPWTNIGTPMTHPDTTIQALGGAIYYQCLIKCGVVSTTSNPVLVTTGFALPAATYTINANAALTYVPGTPGGNFPSFNAAKTAMACGVTGTGNVIFNVLPGLTANSGAYPEQLKLDSIPGVNANRRIIFNGNGNTIAMPTAGPSSTTERAVIKLNGADYITFDSLRINSITTVATYSHGVHLTNNADSNIFRKCVILASQTVAQSTTGFAAVVINSTDASAITAPTVLTAMCDGNIFDRDTISGGYYGIAIAAGSTIPVSVANNSFTNNYITDFYTYGLYASGTYNTLIEGNTFTRPTRVSVIAANAIYLTTNPSLRMSISKNRITKLFGGAPTNTSGLYGIYSNSVDAQSGNEVFVTNNLLYNLDGAGPIYGIYNVGSDNFFYYHNTISIDNATVATTAAVGFYQQTLATGVKFKNNIVTVRRATNSLKQGIALVTNPTDVESDYNDILVTGPTGTNVFGTYGTVNYPTLAAWTAATTDDANSLSIDPFYLDTLNGNYKPNSVSIDNKGTGLNILTDILNVTRSLFTPDLGAYEFTPLPCVNPPVPGTAVVLLPNPNTGTCLEQPIRLNVTGSSPLGSLKFQWQSSTTGGNPWTNLGPVLYNPLYDTVSSVSRFYRCIVQCGTGTQVVTNVVSIQLNSLLPPGTYTVDPTKPQATLPYGVGANFQTMQSAVAAVACGISGNIFFDVKGTFNEQVTVPYVPGGGANATVTFRAFDGNPASAVVTAAGSGTNNSVLLLDSAKYFFFRNMTFTNTSTTNGRVVVLRNGSANDSITNCVINTPATTSIANTNAAVFINALRGTNNIIKGNTINNGSTGIYVAGLSPAIPILNHLVDSNIINNPYVNGIYDTAWQGTKLTRNTINMALPLAPTSYGIYVLNCDSSLLVTGNKINIASSAAANTVYGISINNSDGSLLKPGLLTGNDIVAKAANAGTLYGINVGGTTTAFPSPFINVWNNTVALKTTGTTSYGIYHGNSSFASYYNNSVNTLAAGATTSYAAYVANTSASSINVYNNIFSHKGGGRALYMSLPNGILSNYNMLYTTGANLVQAGATSYTTLNAWNLTNFQDLFSMVYSPAFVNDSTLKPDLANPDVWAIHGRGTQIAGNNYDHDNAVRPTTLTTGVPDLGAYEFYPTAQPTVLTAVPAAPAANSTQSFLYGTDTVMKIKWYATVPPSIAIRRFSGVVPSGVSAQNLDSMYFYTQVQIPGAASYQYDARLFYVDSWLGSIGNINNGVYQMGLGKTSPAAGNPWIVGFKSRNLPTKRMIYEDSLNTNLDRFTGLINPYAPPVLPDQDTSNAGKRFYVAYPINQLNTGSNQQMTLYFSAGAEQANVQVKIGGTNYVRDYIVAPNTVVSTATVANPDYIPKTGAQSAYLPLSGIFDQSIRIESDVPVVAYAHYTGSASSGAAMLMPVGTWGYEYKTLCIEGSGNFSDARPYFTVIADNDNTQVQITPNGPVTNAGMIPNAVNTVILNKGQVLQVIGTSNQQVMTGSIVKSVPNSAGKCYPVAVFSGHSRMSINISGVNSGGDFMMQQNFPSTAWGKRYLTAPTSASNNANTLATNVFRIAVKDPTTVVKLNGNVMTPLYNNHYYQFTSSTADLIEADKPVMVAQFTGDGSALGLSGAVGDPEMMYISPIEQRVKKVSFYRNTVESINANLLTMIIPTNGISSLVIKDAGVVQTPDYVYPHPANGSLALRGVAYSVVVKRWPSAQRQVSVESDSSFTGITYGLGSVESYGYNMGTLIKNLGVKPDTLINVTTNSLYNCVGTPFKIRVRTSILPTSMTYKFSQVPSITPNADVTINNPVPSATTFDSNGDPVYTFTLNTYYTFSTPGVKTIPVIITNPEIESCDNSLTTNLNVFVLPAPNVGFQISFAGCQNNTATFTADPGTSSGINANTWTWGFNNGTTATGQTATFTYNTAGTFYDTLHVVTSDGCLKDTIRATVVNPLPIVTVAATDSVAICPGGSASFTASSQVAGSTYSWYTTPTGGTAIVTGGNYVIGAGGTTISVSNVAIKTVLYVEGKSGFGCISSTRKRVVIDVLPPLTSTVVSVSARAASSVAFTWTAITGAANYSVSVNGGAFITPSGPGLSHIVTGLGVLDSARIVVRANGIITCQNSLSSPLKGCSDSQPTVAVDSMAVCVNNAPATAFTAQPTPTNITYSWYDALSGGTLLGSSSTYNPGAISIPKTSYNYFLQHTNNATGCTSALPRAKVTLNVLAPLVKAVVNVDTLTGITPTSITFTWPAVPGAVGGYEVSVNGGPFITPSSGSFGLSHIVSGLLPSTFATVVVKAKGYLPCQESLSNPRTSKTYTDQVYVPNAFNPNSGNVDNRVLRVYGYVIKDIQFMVFNQWGEKVFSTTDQNIGWNGIYKGKPLPSGVYIYVMKWTHINGTVNNMKGSISLIR